MNVDGEGGEEGMRMEEKLVFMWGYLPGALPQRAPILSPVVVRLPHGEKAWKDVCGGGCGFAMAISGNLELDLCAFLLVLFFKVSFLSELWFQIRHFSFFPGRFSNGSDAFLSFFCWSTLNKALRNLSFSEFLLLSI